MPLSTAADCVPRRLTAGGLRLTACGRRLSGVGACTIVERVLGAGESLSGLRPAN